MAEVGLLQGQPAYCAGRDRTTIRASAWRGEATTLMPKAGSGRKATVLKTLMVGLAGVAAPALTTRSCSERRTASNRACPGRSVGLPFAASQQKPLSRPGGQAVLRREAHGLVRASGVAVRAEEGSGQVEAGLAAFKDLRRATGQATPGPHLEKSTSGRPGTCPATRLALGIGHGAMALA